MYRRQGLVLSISYPEGRVVLAPRSLVVSVGGVDVSVTKQFLDLLRFPVFVLAEPVSDMADYEDGCDGPKIKPPDIEGLRR